MAFIFMGGLRVLRLYRCESERKGDGQRWGESVEYRIKVGGGAKFPKRGELERGKSTLQAINKIIIIIIKNKGMIEERGGWPEGIGFAHFAFSKRKRTEYCAFSV